MRKLLLIILLAGIILAIIISIGRIPARNLTLNRDDGTIVKVSRGMLRYDISDILRKQFRVNFSAKGLTLSRDIQAPKGFLPSFLLPEPQSQLTFDNVAASLNFKKGAIELENLQLIGNDITITGSGKSIGKRSINYTFILTPSKETAKKLLARLGNDGREDEIKARGFNGVGAEGVNTRTGSPAGQQKHETHTWHYTFHDTIWTFRCDNPTRWGCSRQAEIRAGLSVS